MHIGFFGMLVYNLQQPLVIELGSGALWAHIPAHRAQRKSGRSSLGNFFFKKRAKYILWCLRVNSSYCGSETNTGKALNLALKDFWACAIFGNFAPLAAIDRFVAGVGARTSMEFG